MVYAYDEYYCKICDTEANVKTCRIQDYSPGYCLLIIIIWKIDLLILYYPEQERECQVAEFKKR